MEVRVVVGNVAEEEGEDGVESPTEVESIEDETVRTAETVAQCTGTKIGEVLQNADSNEGCAIAGTISQSALRARCMQLMPLW